MGGDPPDALRRGLSIKEIARRTGRDRNTIRRRSPRRAAALRAPVAASKLDPFSARRSTGCCAIRGCRQRIRELIEELGYRGGKTIVDDYLREVRPLFCRAAHLSAHGLSAGRDLASSTSGSRGARSRSATARRAAAGS